VTDYKGIKIQPNIFKAAESEEFEILVDFVSIKGRTVADYCFVPC